MGQKTNPIGNRLGLIRTWDSVWYGGRNYGDKILEDHKIRSYLKLRLSKCSVAKPTCSERAKEPRCSELCRLSIPGLAAKR